MCFLNVATLNVRGINSNVFRQQKIDYLLNTNSDILCTQELRLTTDEDVKNVCDMWYKGKSVISIGENSADGVGIFFNTQEVNIIRRRDIIPGRLLMIDCFYRKDKYRIINVYTSPERTKKKQLFKRLRELLSVGYNIILCEDFNTVISENDRHSAVPFTLTSEGKVLKEICEEFKLIDVYRSLNPSGFDFTRFDAKTKTRIDRM